MDTFGNKIIYEIYPKSFKDSNGDGIGDIKGIIEQLDYLSWLGIDYLWLTPIFLSPQMDNGYDVKDYLTIDPSFGTMSDLEDLIMKAKTYHINIMLDMVFNHTSTEHVWFQKAMSGDPVYMNYYIFEDSFDDLPPTNWQSKFGGSSWEYIPHLKKWYLHLFDKTQADLNWEYKAVREELKQIIRFWKEKGIKGFRFDVINLISKPDTFTDDLYGDGRMMYTDGYRVHDYLKELVLDTGIQDIMTVGEMSSTSIDHCVRYSNPNEHELSMCFHFHHLKVDYKDGDKWKWSDPDLMTLKKLMIEWQVSMQEKDGWDSLFWCNHDQPRIVSRLGNEKKYWKESAKMLAASMYLLRGTPCIYQGEELGIGNAHYRSIESYCDIESLHYYDILMKQGNSEEDALSLLSKRSRDNARTPMHWNEKEFAGFSSHKPWIDMSEDFLHANVEIEQKDPDSILTFYKKLIALRKEKRVISNGYIEFFLTDDPNIFVYRRYGNDQIETNEDIYVLCNFKDYDVIIELPFDSNNCFYLLNNYGLSGNFSPSTSEMFQLKAYEVIVLSKNTKT